MNLFEDSEIPSYFTDPLIEYPKQNKFFLSQEKSNFYLIQVLKEFSTILKNSGREIYN